MNKILKSILFVFVATFLFILVAHDSDRYPLGAHGEEQAFGLAGVSLWKSGTPVSWSHFDYPDDNIIYKGPIGKPEDGPVLFVELVKPWFDHPPLFYAMATYMSHIKGEDERSIISAGYLRFTSVIAFWLTLISIFYFAKRLYGYWIGLFSMIAFGTTPLFVFAGRMAVPEVFFALFLVIMMICWLHYKDKYKWLWLVPIALIPPVAGLMKFTGYFLLPLFVFFLLRERKFKASIIVTLFLIPSFYALFLFAKQYDLNLFWELVQRQSFRPVGWTGLPFIFSSPGYDIGTYFDGIYVLSLLSVVVLAFTKSKKEDNYVLWPVFYWLSVLVVSGGQQDMLAWYRTAMYPFLAVSLVLLIKKILAKPDFFSSLLIVGMSLTSRHYLSNAFRPDVMPGVFRAEFFALLLPSLMIEIDKVRENLWNKIAKIILILIIILGLWLNIKYIYSVFPIRCESISCPIGPTTWVSELRYPILWRLLLP